MKLRYITCSDPREDISPESLLNFTTKYPISEIGVQAHPGSMTKWLPRNLWFDKVVDLSKNMLTPPNIALHINYRWCDFICAGIIPYEVSRWLLVSNTHTKQPVIKRVQLNIGDNTTSFDAQKLAEVIKQNPNQEFIFPWNKQVAPQIRALKRTGVKFSLLFDRSYGAGIETDEWRKPVYVNVPNGYAGGLGPDNVAENLDKINTLLPQNYETWIDAEGKLRDRKTTGSFTLELAEKYMQNAMGWYKLHNQNTK